LNAKAIARIEQTETEARDEARLTKLSNDAVLARQDIAPGTCVARSFGRMFDQRTHRAAFPRGDRWEQWCVAWDADARRLVSAVVTPGLPDGTMDAAFLRPSHGQAPFPRVRNAANPSCCYVINLDKRARLEYWTRRPVRRGEELTIAYGAFPKTAASRVARMDLIFIKRGQSVMPVRYLATTPGRGLLPKGWPVDAWRQTATANRERQSAGRKALRNAASKVIQRAWRRTRSR
jgi:hypothetical protein